MALSGLTPVDRAGPRNGRYVCGVGRPELDLGPILDVVRRCGPDEGPLRERVMRTLRKRSDVLNDVANGEPMAYEGSLATLRVFIGTEAWPERDSGWVAETCSLAGYEYWYAKRDRPRWSDDVGKDGRPGPRLTLRTLCAGVLLGDCARHATFTDAEGPGPGPCLAIVDGAVRLGEDWPQLALAWLADYALYHAESEEFLPELDVVGVVGAMLLLASWLAGEDAENLPVAGLFECCEQLDAHILRCGLREKRGPWLARAMGLSKTWVPGAIAESQIRPRLKRLDGEAREVAERVCGRLAAKR